MAKGAHGMETKDHYYLSKNLAGAMQLGKLNKILFILGNLIPDINPFSYITDAGGSRFSGHSFTSAAPNLGKIPSQKPRFCDFRRAAFLAAFR